jgi:putative Holliday junction resolvase
MVLKRRGEPEDIDVINRLVRENQAARVIIGLPLKMDGQVGEQAAKVKAFATQLEESSPVPLIFRDERLSTVTAQHLRWEAAAGKRVRKAPDDDAAAAVILQGYLDETRL